MLVPWFCHGQERGGEVPRRKLVVEEMCSSGVDTLDLLQKEEELVCAFASWLCLVRFRILHSARFAPGQVFDLRARIGRG